MSDYVANQDLYLGITPGGAFYATQDKTPAAPRQFIHRVLQTPVTPLFTQETAGRLTGQKPYKALEFVHYLEEAGLLTGLEEPETAPRENFEDVLNRLLPKLSDDGKAALADGQGLCLGGVGFETSLLDELAALSASIASVNERHHRILSKGLGHRQKAWGLVDASGNSQIGFWPLFLGDDLFTLMIGGMPQFNQQTFKRFVWALEMRHGKAM